MPESISLERDFALFTPDVTDVDRVVLMRHGSPMHAFDIEQRAIELKITRREPASNRIIVEAPPLERGHDWSAPEGPYMLFLVGRNGAVGVARSLFVRRP